MAKKILILFLVLMSFTSLKSQNVFGDLNFICSNQSISVGAPIETEYDEIFTSCHWQPLSSYIEFYQVIIESGTTFTFTITPNAQVDYDFASWLNPDPADLGYPDRSSQNNPDLTNMYDLGLSLTELNQLCESGNSTGYPEPGFVRYYEVQPGDMIIIAIDRYMEDDQGYTLSFGGNAELSCSFTYSLCDENGDGEEDFDLNQIALNIQQTRYPEYNITFYDTEFNAESGTSVGQLTGNYTAYTANNPNVIYARLEAQNGDFIEAVDIRLNVNGYPEIEEIPALYYCGSSGEDAGIFDLTQAFENIISDPENYLIKFYLSEQGAQDENQSEEIFNPSMYLSDSDTVYVRIRNEYGCHIIKPLNLVISVNLESQELVLPLICLEESTTNVNLEDYREALTDEGFLSYQFEYYLDEADAQAGNSGNAMTNPGSFPVLPENTYTVYVRIIMGTNCPPVISSITFTVGQSPDITIVTPQETCFGESIILTADTSSNVVRWYNSEDAETSMFIGNPFVTTPEETTTFWVEAESLEGCISERIPVEVLVHPLPTFTFDTPNPICTGSSTNIDITTATNIVNWYENEFDTTPIFTGNPFTTPNLTETTSYWVEVESDESCTSERQEIIVEVTDEIIPEFTQVVPQCEGNSFTLPNTSNNGITGTWSPAIDNTQTTIYTFHPDSGQCAAENVTMTVQIVPIPELTLPTLPEICSGETISITVSTTNGIINWYEDELDTTPIFTGAIYSIEPTTTTTIWVEAIDGNCPSTRESITITVNELPTITANPSNPVCVGNSVELSVTTNGTTVNWYTSSIGTTPIFTGNPFTTPNLTETTIYYVESINSNNCTSERIEVQATVTNEIIPEFTQIETQCEGSVFVLPTVSSNGITGTWLPAIDNTQTTIYTFHPDAGQCAAENVTMTVQIVPIPELILPTEEIISCVAQTIPITITTTNGTVNWYAYEFDTIPIYTGTTYSPTLSITTTYWVEAQTGNCKSERESVTVTVYPTPEMQEFSSIMICDGDQFEFSAPEGFDYYQWKNQSGTIISNEATVVFTQEGTYTLMASINGIPCPVYRNLMVSFSTTPVITEIKSTESSLTVYAIGDGPFEYSLDNIFWQSSNTFYNLQPGIYFIYVRDKEGCGTSAKQGAIMGVSNFISPNGDGRNDTWKIRALEAFPNTRLQIFDRYGKMFVDRILDGDFEWDGKYNSQPLPSGSYWYILTLEKGEKLSGYISIRNQ